MTTLKVVKVDATEHHGTALIAADDSVWIAVALRWWDLASKAWVTLTNGRGERVRSRAIRVASKHVRVRSFAGAS